MNNKENFSLKQTEQFFYKQTYWDKIKNLIGIIFKFRDPDSNLYSNVLIEISQ